MSELKIDSLAFGIVIALKHNLALLAFRNGDFGTLHISELSNHYIRHFTGFVKVGNIYRVRILALKKDGTYELSLKKAYCKGKNQHIPHEIDLPGPDDSSLLLHLMPKFLGE